MSFYDKRGKDDVPLIRKKTIVKTFAVFFCVIGGYLFVRTNYSNYIKTTGILNSSHSKEEDWFDANITNFQKKADAHNYIVLRKTAIERYGDSLAKVQRKPEFVRSRSRRSLKPCKSVMSTLMFARDLC